MKKTELCECTHTYGMHVKGQDCHLCLCKKFKIDYKPYFHKWEDILDVKFTFEHIFNRQVNTKSGHRFDAAIICCKIAIEVEGGAFQGQGHRSIGKFLNDMRKYNVANSLGWHIFRFTTTDILTSEFINIITDYLHNFPCTHKNEFKLEG